jgi:hypothetical protein
MFDKQFARAPVLTTPVPKEFFLKSLVKGFQEAAGVEQATSDLGLQYELAVKLKVLMKTL